MPPNQAPRGNLNNTVMHFHYPPYRFTPGVHPPYTLMPGLNEAQSIMLKRTAQLLTHMGRQRCPYGVHAYEEFDYYISPAESHWYDIRGPLGLDWLDFDTERRGDKNVVKVDNGGVYTYNDGAHLVLVVAKMEFNGFPAFECNATLSYSQNYCFNLFHTHSALDRRAILLIQPSAQFNINLAYAAMAAKEVLKQLWGMKHGTTQPNKQNWDSAWYWIIRGPITRDEDPTFVVTGPSWGALHLLADGQEGAWTWNNPKNKKQNKAMEKAEIQRWLPPDLRKQLPEKPKEWYLYISSIELLVSAEGNNEKVMVAKVKMITYRKPQEFVELNLRFRSYGDREVHGMYAGARPWVNLEVKRDEAKVKQENKEIKRDPDIKQEPRDDLYGFNELATRRRRSGSLAAPFRHLNLSLDNSSSLDNLRPQAELSRRQKVIYGSETSSLFARRW